MEASNIKLLDFIKEDTQFIVPEYQRLYSWEKEHCEQLWEDILDAGNSDETISHFMGTIVYVRDEDTKCRLLVDGQQRITTISLLLIALQEELNSGDIPLGNINKDLLEFCNTIKTNTYLLDPSQNGDKKYKLLLSNQDDKNALMDLIDSKDKGEEKRVKDNFKYLKEQIKSNQKKIEIVLKGLKNLEIVYIELTRNDNPQRIFESLNSTGKLLAQTDLIRNFILMDENPEEQSHLHGRYWQEIEKKFHGDEKCFDKFMFHYLVMKEGEIREGEVYERFKQFAGKKKTQDKKQLLENLKKHAEHYCYITARQEDKDSLLKELFRELNQIPSEVTFPFLLRCYDYYKNEKLQKEEFKNIINLTISYIVRLIICKKNQGLNKTFFTFANLINPTKKQDENLPDSIYDRVIRRFETDTTDKSFPTDEDFKTNLQTREIYELHKVKQHLLERIENHGHTKPMDYKETAYTIEHIMPQKLGDSWKEDFQKWGEDGDFLSKTYLHKLGNLTLVDANARLSNKSFEDKKNDNRGYKDNRIIILNRDIINQDKWGEEQIKARAENLAEHALKIWIRPEQLSKPNKQKDSATKNKIENNIYPIEHYFENENRNSRPLYEELKAQITQVAELEQLGKVGEKKVKKTFIILKISQNQKEVVLSIAPRKNYLNLYLHANISELHNLQSKVRDVSSIGHNGRGNMHIKLESPEEIPYCMELIKQALAQK